MVEAERLLRRMQFIIYRDRVREVIRRLHRYTSLGN
jgi:hypothetical protein